LRINAPMSFGTMHLAPALTENEGLVVADLDFRLITKRKRMMDSVGHYARPELLRLAINGQPSSYSEPMFRSESPMTEIDPEGVSGEPSHEAI
ncbi:MAG: hypothetical protein AAGI44_12430, partial [Pseudomonadota bacterium]